jgi:hypothetical protein
MSTIIMIIIAAAIFAVTYFAFGVGRGRRSPEQTPSQDSSTPSVVPETEHTHAPVVEAAEPVVEVVPEPEHTDAPVVEAAEPMVEVVPEVMALGTEELIKVATARKRRTGSTTEGQEKKASRRPRKPAKK